MKTTELLSGILHRVLLEDRIDHLRTTFEAKVLAKLQMEHENGVNDWHTADKVFQYFIDTDPTANKQYVQWLIKLYLTDAVKLEDVYKAQEYLEAFEKQKAAIPVELRNIHQYKTIQDLYKVVRRYRNEDYSSNRQLNKRLDRKMHEDDQVEIIYDSSTMKVVIPKTEEASCYFGRNTQWCTTATGGNNMFDYYSTEGTLYIVLIKKENKRIQIHISNEAMEDIRNVLPENIDELIEEFTDHAPEYTDEHDDPVDMRWFDMKYPELRKALGDLLVDLLIRHSEQHIFDEEEAQTEWDEDLKWEEDNAAQHEYDELDGDGDESN